MSLNCSHGVTLSDCPDRAAHHAYPGVSEGPELKRFDRAVDRVLNSGTMHSYMDDFWRYVDGEISFKEFDQRMPS